MKTVTYVVRAADGSLIQQFDNATDAVEHSRVHCSVGTRVDRMTIEDGGEPVYVLLAKKPRDGEKMPRDPVDEENRREAQHRPRGTWGKRGG